MEDDCGVGLFQEQASTPASWSSGNAFVSGAGGLKFKSLTGQIGHSVANDSPPLRYFFKSSKLCCQGAMMRKWTP